LSNPIRFGMAGIGNEGAGVVPFFEQVDDVDLVAAADLRVDALDAFQEDHPGAETFTSLKAMCESGAIDAVWISTPSQFHAEHAITAAEAGGQRANDLRDRRRTAVADLAGVVGVQTVETADGALTVSAANGAVLVDGGGVVHQLAVRKQVVGLDGQALHEAGLADRSGNFIAVPGTFAHGELAALARVRDSDLVGASGQLDGFASAIITEVNRVQTNGGAGAVDLDGGSTAAVPLFGGTDAKTITVLLTGADAGRRIGAALSAEPGDNQNALALADLRTTAQGALGATTFSGFLAGLTGQVGESAAQARDGAQAAEALQQQLHNQRESFSGVNLNEELTNLLRYQRAFQASAEAINVGNQVLDELMQLVR